MQVKLIYLMVIRLNPATGKECHISKFENSFAIASEEEGGRGQLTNFTNLILTTLLTYPKIIGENKEFEGKIEKNENKKGVESCPEVNKKWL